MLDTRYPDWLIPRQSPWQSANLGAQIGAQIAQNRYRNQALAAQMLVRHREMELDREKFMVEKQMKWQMLQDERREIDDLKLLQEYARDPDAGIPDFKSPKSYSRLAQVDLARSRSDLGRQTAADLKDFNTRLLKVAPEDRAAIRDMQRGGAPESEVWSYLGTAERAEQQRLLDAKRELTPYQERTLDLRETAQANTAEHRAAQVELQKSKMAQDLAKFDLQHDVTLQKLGFTKERLALDREKLKQGKTFAPTELRKLFDEANDAEMKGMTEEADILRERARTLARGGRLASIQNIRITDVDRVKLGDIKSRITGIDRVIAGKFVTDTNELTQLRKDRSELEKQRAGILGKYEPAQSVGTRGTHQAAAALAEKEGLAFRVDVDRPGVPKARTQADADEAIRQAREAIGAGADPEAVKERLRQMGLQLE